MYLDIYSKEPSSILSKSGDEIQGIKIEGVVPVSQYNNQEKPWEKFFPTFTDQYKMFEQFDVGDRVNVKNEKNGKFWDITSVSLVKKGSGGGSKKQESSKVETRPEIPVAKFEVPIPSENQALTVASNIVSAMLSSPAEYSKLFKKTSTKEEVEDYLFALTDKIKLFMECKITSTVESDTKDITEPPSIPEIPEDDIPF